MVGKIDDKTPLRTVTTYVLPWDTKHYSQQAMQTKATSDHNRSEKTSWELIVARFEVDCQPEFEFKLKCWFKSADTKNAHQKLCKILPTGVKGRMGDG